MNMRPTRYAARWTAAMACCLFCAVQVPADEQDIPRALLPWQGWVLWDQHDADSPRPFDDYEQPIRVWPSRLNLTVNDSGGSWQFDVRVFDTAWVTLPGSAQHWPQNVRVGNGPVAVVERDTAPAIRLSRGTHQIVGEFLWREMPQRVRLPRTIGLLSLTINNEAVALPSWDAEGQVWLKRANLEAAEKDLLSIQVYRVIEDGIPLWLRTEIELTVSGKSREEKLGSILPAGWELSHVSSAIPVAVDGEGRMKAQVRAGKWQILINAFRNTPLDTIRYAADSQPPTETELVAFDARPDFRIAELEGAQQVDVSQTTFPERWRNLPVYEWRADRELTMVEKQRGLGDQHLTGLNIERRLWLDEDGQAFTYLDTVSGRSQQLWRLDAGAGQELSAVRSDGQPQLITTNPKTDLPGVEIRNRNVNLQAVGRVARAEQLSAIGWDTDADALQLSFLLPPGWRMIALFGADRVHGDWLTAWTLLDLFLLLVFSVAVFRLWGFGAGVVALLALGLSFHTPYSPRFTWFFLLIPIALLRVVPDGVIKRLLTLWKWTALVLLVLCLVPFAVRQIQITLYPQLESSTAYYGQRGGPWGPAFESAAAPVVPQASKGDSDLAVELSGEATEGLGRQSNSLPSRGRRGYAKVNLAQRSDARVQTGRAMPQWGGNQVTCSWSGPVASGQQITPVLLSCGAHRMLTVIRVTLLFLLAAILLRISKPLRRPTVGHAAAAAVALGLFLEPSPCPAQIPEPQMLETLRQRLLEPPSAFPHAAEIASVKLTIDDRRLTMTAEVHAAVTVAAPLPGKLPSWSPLSVTVDGDPAPLVCRRSDGYLWVTVSKGVHQVVVEGLLSETPEWEWTFVLPPRQLTIDAPGWNIAGVDADGVPGKQVFFVKQEQRNDGEASYDQENFRAIAQIERNLEAGLVWNATTTVKRISAMGKAISLKIPLLPGESVLTANQVVKDGRVQVDLAADQLQFTWQSEIAPSPQIELQAAETDQWVEVWRLATSPVWNVAFAGLAPIYQADDSRLTPEWHPWPGESATLSFTRPVAIPGETVTVQQVTHVTKLGMRRRETTLRLDVETSLGGDFVVDMDADAEVRSVTVQNRKNITRRSGRELIVPLLPGRQWVQIDYDLARDLEMVTSVEPIKLPVDGANVTTQIKLSANRWVLWADGPLRGPAVQFWVILAAALLVALVLGSLSFSPLRRFEWVLLIIGLTQVPLPAAMLVIGWLFLLAWRGQRDAAKIAYWRFNLLQLTVVLSTVIALGILVAAVGEGLLGNPDMFIIGNGSGRNTLKWYQPRTGLELPQPTVISISVWFYRLLMLFWALWLAMAVIRWLQLGWAAFSKDTFWKHRPARPAAQKPPTEPKGSPPREADA